MSRDDTAACRRQVVSPAWRPRPPPARPSRGTGASRRPPRSSSSSCVPCSTIRPPSSTTMRPAWRIVDSRWAMTIAVRPGEQPAQRRLDAALGVQVDVRGRLVEDRGSAGRRRARGRRRRAGAGRRTAARRARRSRVSRPCSRRSMNSHAPTARARGLELRRRVASGPAERDVLADRPAEQERLLRDDPHLRAQRRARHVAQVVAVDEHPPLGRVVEARDELGERRLAGAGRADERDGLRRRDVERRRRPARASRGRRRCGRRTTRRRSRSRRAAVAAAPTAPGASTRSGCVVEQLEDLVERGHARLVGRVDLRELADRVEEAVQRGDERRRARRSMISPSIACMPPTSRIDDRRERADELDRREVRRVEVDGRHVRVAVALVERGERGRGGAAPCANARTTRTPLTASPAGSR